MTLSNRLFINIFIIYVLFNASNCEETLDVAETTNDLAAAAGSGGFPKISVADWFTPSAQKRQRSAIKGKRDLDEVQAKNSTVKLTVYYEALCPYSILFFNSQLSSIYPALGKYIQLDLIPYGNAQKKFEHGRWSFKCQHGVRECKYNKLQACAVENIKNETALFKFVSCLMKDKKEAQRLSKCTDSAGVDLAPLYECTNSTAGDEALAKLGTRTEDCTPPIDGVPSVAFNDVFSYDDQDEALTDLGKIVCSHLNPRPSVCDKYKNTPTPTVLSDSD